MVELTKNCACCALGACFLAYMRLYNKIRPEAIIDNYRGKNYLHASFNIIREQMADVFEARQLKMIESHFMRKCQPDDLEVCLTAIMKNIIKNDGFYSLNGI